MFNWRRTILASFVYLLKSQEAEMTPLLMLCNTTNLHYAINILLIHHHWHIWYWWSINNLSVIRKCVPWIGSLLHVLSLLIGFLTYFSAFSGKQEMNMSCLNFQDHTFEIWLRNYFIHISWCLEYQYVSNGIDGKKFWGGFFRTSQSKFDAYNLKTINYIVNMIKLLLMI